MKKLFLIVCFVSAFPVLNAQTVYYSQDFEGTGIPSGWSQSTLATDGGWNFGTNVQLQSTSFPIAAHTKMAATNDDKCNCNKSNDLLYSLALDLSAASSQVYMSYDCFYFNLSYQGITEQAKIVASTDGGATWTDILIVPANSGNGWQTNFVDLSSYSGNSDVRVGFHYSDGSGWLYGWAIDNVSVFSPPIGVDLAVTSVQVGKMDPTPAFVGFSKYLTSYPLDVRVTVFNQASMDITSFDFSWTDGTNVYNQSVSGTTIGAMQSFTFNASTGYTTLAGINSITGTISNINGGAVELSTTNNSGNFSVEGVTAHPDRNYIAEEGTGTWCGWCPRGTVFMDYMRKTYSDKFVGVAVHNGDPMTVAAYDGGLGITAFPGVKIYRSATIDPSELEADFINKISAAPLVTISGTAILNTSNSNLSVDLTGIFSQNLSGDYRFAAVLREDSVHNNSYNQTNYYGNNANGPMGGYELLGPTVPGSMMYYDFVGRMLIGGFTGQFGSIPNAITSGTPYSYQLNATVPGTFVQSQLSVAGLVINTANGQILNALNIPISFTTGINEANQTIGLMVYPNPVADKINLEINSKKSQSIEISITDATGRICRNETLKIASGNNHLKLDATAFAAGIYLLNVKTEEGTILRKFSK